MVAPSAVHPARPRAKARSDCADARNTGARRATLRSGNCRGSARAHRKLRPAGGRAAGPQSKIPRPRMQPHREIEGDAGKYRETEPMIGEEGAKATLALARADEPQVVTGKGCCRRKSRPEQGP